MTVVALAVLLILVAVSAWAWRQSPGRRAADEFREIWQKPWGKQLMLDFFGLEAILALWILSDASSRGTWGSAIACIAAMPIFGSMSAAAYWLLNLG